MSNSEDINREIEENINGFPQFHYLCAKWCLAMAEETNDELVKQAYKNRAEFHKLIGDNQHAR